MRKASSNCWTCKERKIGCDRSLPLCSNCERCHRTCQGYGLRLSWPDKVDGRRKPKRYPVDHASTTVMNYVGTGYTGLAFLNTTVQDLRGSRIDIEEITKLDLKARHLSITRSLSTIPDFESNDTYLLTYYDQVLARMVTTIDDNSNGFRVDLIPMALSPDMGGQGLLLATLALSSYHLGRVEDALKYKIRAIKALFKAFQFETTNKLSQFATCLMLCVYSVFDVSDPTWHLHLQGAKSIAAVLTNAERESLPFEFLSSWFNYHNTFSSFSQSIGIVFVDSVLGIQIPDQNDATRKIIGCLGCSAELLGLISCINQLRALSDRHEWYPHNPNHEVLSFANLIRERLSNLNQEIRINSREADGTMDPDRTGRTAEFYRIGALLYLYQVAPSQIIPEDGVQSLVDDGFVILDQMEVCTSPWPLFLLACNVTTDLDRLRILHVLDTMDEKRRIGNYQIIRSVIQGVWKQEDLRADAKTPKRVDWRSLVDPGTCIPSFI